MIGRVIIRCSRVDRLCHGALDLLGGSGACQLCTEATSFKTLSLTVSITISTNKLGTITDVTSVYLRGVSEVFAL